MRTMTDAYRRHKAEVAKLDAQLDRQQEAERLLRWAQKATEVCGAWELRELAKRCAMYMNGAMHDRGDESGRYWLEYRLEEAGVEPKNARGTLEELKLLLEALPEAERNPLR